VRILFERLSGIRIARSYEGERKKKGRGKKRNLCRTSAVHSPVKSGERVLKRKKKKEKEEGKARGTPTR